MGFAAAHRRSGRGDSRRQAISCQNITAPPLPLLKRPPDLEGDLPALGQAVEFFGVDVVVFAGLLQFSAEGADAAEFDGLAPVGFGSDDGVHGADDALRLVGRDAGLRLDGAG